MGILNTIKLGDGSSAFDPTNLVRQAYSIANAPYTAPYAGNSAASVPGSPAATNLSALEQRLLSQFRPAGVSSLNTSA